MPTGAREQIERIIAARAFAPVFQPVVMLGERRVVGYEALTRFADGASPAGRFVAAAALGVGPALEMACIEAALEAATALPADAWISLNASPQLLVRGSGLQSALRSSSRSVVLEVTEHVAIDDFEALLGALRALGPRVRLAVDDAGAGYAGLRQILELHADIVKLDIGLVQGVDHDPARQALIAGLAHFAARTGSQLLAEGIETAGEAEAVAALGVELGQGYFFGRPQPASRGRASAARAARPAACRS